MPNPNNLCKASSFNNNCLLNSIALGLLEQRVSAGRPDFLENETFRRAFTVYHKLNTSDANYVASADVIDAFLQQRNSSIAKQDLLGPVLRSMLNGEAARKDKEALLLAFESFLIKMHEYFLEHATDLHNETDDADDFARFQHYLTANENRGLAAYMSQKAYRDLKNLFYLHREEHDDEYDLTTHFVTYCKQNNDLVNLVDTTLYQPYCDHIATPNEKLEPVDVQVLLNTFNLKLDAYTENGDPIISQERQTQAGDLNPPLMIEVQFINGNHYDYYAKNPGFERSLAFISSASSARNARIEEVNAQGAPIVRDNPRSSTAHMLEEFDDAPQAVSKHLIETIQRLPNQNQESVHAELKQVSAKARQEEFDALFARNIAHLQATHNEDNLEHEAFEKTMQTIHRLTMH